MIEKDVTAEYIGSDGIRSPFPCTLRFSEESPLEVAVVLYTGGSETVVWYLLRDALMRACHSTFPKGEGDVRMFACVPGKTVHLILQGDWNGEWITSHIDLPYDGIQEFLMASDSLVGVFGAHIPAEVMDETIRRLLEGA